MRSLTIKSATVGPSAVHSNSFHKRISDKGQQPLGTGNVSQALIAVVQGLNVNGPEQQVQYPILLRQPQQDTLRDANECLLQVHKT